MKIADLDCETKVKEWAGFAEVEQQVQMDRGGFQGRSQIWPRRTQRAHRHRSRGEVATRWKLQRHKWCIGRLTSQRMKARNCGGYQGEQDKVKPLLWRTSRQRQLRSHHGRIIPSSKIPDLKAKTCEKVARVNDWDGSLGGASADDCVLSKSEEHKREANSSLTNLSALVGVERKGSTVGRTVARYVGKQQRGMLVMLSKQSGRLCWVWKGVTVERKL